MIDNSHVLISYHHFLICRAGNRAPAPAPAVRLLSSNMEIGEPAVLARLPRAGLTGEGQTKFCQVYGIRAQQKKKRHEICAAVDGNSLNIFEVCESRYILCCGVNSSLGRQWQKRSILARPTRCHVR